VDAGALPKLEPARRRLRLPDKALLLVARAALGEYCGDLLVGEIAGADQLAVHQQTEHVTRLIGAFFGD